MEGGVGGGGGGVVELLISELSGGVRYYPIPHQKLECHVYFYHLPPIF